MSYFPAATPECPTFGADSSWRPLLDGATYLPELSRVLDAARPGDAVWIAGFEFDPALDLDGRPAGTLGHRPIGERLARLAADGIDVRLLLASRVIASSVPGTVLGDFHTTARRAHALRRVASNGATPLTTRVLLDFGGALLGTNHHKFVALRIGGAHIAFAGGIDLVADRFDATPHDTMRLDGAAWGWHDAAVRVDGAAAARVAEIFGARWAAALALPRRWFLRRGLRPALLNDPARLLPAPDVAHPHADASGPTTIRVLRSRGAWQLDSLVPWRRKPWPDGRRGIVAEVFDTLVSAFAAAQRYIYLEDQYLCEAVGAFGGNRRYELYPHLRAAAARGVRVILVGSGTRDPGDPGIHVAPINRTVNRDIQRKIVDRLPADRRGTVGVYRVEGVTVHAKLVLVDDAFACIGSANMFGRSMAGTDAELSVAVETSTGLVRELRVAVWSDHARTDVPVDLDAALLAWQPADRGGLRYVGP